VSGCSPEGSAHWAERVAAKGRAGARGRQGGSPGSSLAPAWNRRGGGRRQENASAR
jgi:hypothetical protein